MELPVPARPFLSDSVLRILALLLDKDVLIIVEHLANFHVCPRRRQLLRHERALVVNLVAHVEVTLVLEAHFGCVPAETAHGDVELDDFVQTIGRGEQPVFLGVINNGHALVADHFVVHNLHVELVVDRKCFITLDVLVVQLVALGTKHRQDPV